MTSQWVENTTLLRNYSQFLGAQIVSGSKYSLIVSTPSKRVPSDPYFQGYDIIEYVQQDETISVLIQLRPDQDSEHLFTHMKVVAMSVPDIASIPVRYYNVTTLSSNGKEDHISRVMPISR